MDGRDESAGAAPYAPGEVLVLLTPLQEMETGLYVVYAVGEGWVVLRWVIDDEAADQLLVTKRESRLPSALLRLFMPVGLQLAIDKPIRFAH